MPSPPLILGCGAQVLDEAKALATALSTIGKFTVKVKVGEDKRIFGRHVARSLAPPRRKRSPDACLPRKLLSPQNSVSEQDVIDAVQKQTNKVLEKKGLTLPEIKLTGAYEVQAKLHPQVTAKFQLLVVKL